MIFQCFVILSSGFLSYFVYKTLINDANEINNIFSNISKVFAFSILNLAVTVFVLSLFDRINFKTCNYGSYIEINKTFCIILPILAIILGFLASILNKIIITIKFEKRDTNEKKDNN